MKKIVIVLLTLLVVSCCVFLSACETVEIKDKEQQEKTEETEVLSEIIGVTFSNYSVDYDGTEKVIEISGTLPEGVSVSYSNNKGINAGEYRASATLSGDGYKTKVLNATLTINRLNYDVSSVSWEYSNAYTYDGTEKQVKLSNLPSGVTVSSYNNNAKTDAGTYSATANLNYDKVNYNAPNIPTCNWTINKANLSLSMEQTQEITYDDKSHLPKYEGTLPLGVSVKYYFDTVESADGVKDINTYQVRVVFSSKNYNELTLTGTFKIKFDAINFAKKVIKSFGKTPEPWNFLPQSFNPSNRVIDEVVDYTNFVNISDIPQNGIGKQMNTVYSVLNKMDVALDKVNQVYNVLNTLESAYATFMANATEGKNYNYNAGAFTIALTVAKSGYNMSTSIGGVSLNIYSDLDNNSYGAKIQLSSNTALRFDIGENSMKVALVVLNVSSTQIEFVRNDNKVSGYIYDNISLGGTSIKTTSALIKIDDNYTTVVGNKGDFENPLSKENRNCEVYSNSTGKLVGAEVREELTIESLTAVYNTLWYNLYDITNINNIKKEDKECGKNPDTIYINNNANHIGSKIVGVGGGNKILSRRFDIEFKTMYFYQYDNTGKEYKEVECEIPMLFVQEENANTLITDFSKENKSSLNNQQITLNVSEQDKTAIYNAYHSLLETYNTIKEQVTKESIESYCNG